MTTRPDSLAQDLKAWAADQLQVLDREQQGHRRGSHDPEDDRGAGSEHDRPAALRARQPARDHPDDERVVTGHREVDKCDREDGLEDLAHR